jgi:uncharacterized protein YggE
MSMKVQVGLAAAVAAVALVPAAQAQAPAKSVTASGIGSVSVKPDDKTSNASIKAAVEAAEASAQPKAIAAAREDATRLATASGLTLGGIVSISDVPATPPYFYGPFYPYTGTFGPGKYCGVVRSSHLKRLANGRLQRVLGKRHRICRIPPNVTVTLSVTFAAS